MLGNYLIGLREGLEATLVVSILVAYLVKTNRREKLSAVWLGVGAAIVLSLAIGAVLTFGSSALSFEAQEAFGGIMSFIAVGLVTWMIFWMRNAARSIKKELEGAVDRALAIGTGALIATSFVSVAREGIETALFVWPAVQAAGSGFEPLAGVILGLLSAVVLGYLIYNRAVAINLGRFFTWTGAVLVVVAAGVLTYGIAEFQEIGWLPGATTIAFDFTSTLGPDSIGGTLLRGILNIHPLTTWLQVIAWFAYLIPVMYLFLHKPAAQTTKTTPAAHNTPAPAQPQSAQQ